MFSLFLASQAVEMASLGVDYPLCTKRNPVGCWLFWRSWSHAPGGFHRKRAVVEDHPGREAPQGHFLPGRFNLREIPEFHGSWSGRQT